MRALLIVESCFGGTRALAEQVAAGLQQEGAAVELVDSEEAPAELPSDLDLLILAAPTHNRGLPTPQSWRQAVGGGGRAALRGIREWLEEARIPGAVEVRAFDTVTGHGWLNGSAAKRIVKILAGRRPAVSATARSFLVDDRTPVAGQAQEARAWGRGLALG